MPFEEDDRKKRRRRFAGKHASSLENHGTRGSPPESVAARDPRVLIVEQRHSGHLLVYVRELVLAARDLGYTPVVAIGTEVPSTPEFANTILNLDVETITFDGDLTPLTARKLSLRAGASAVIVPHGDELAGRLGWGMRASPVPIVVLIMRDPAWEWADSSIPRRTRLLLKRVLVFLASRRRNVEVVWLRSFGSADALGQAVDPFIADGTIDEVRRSADAFRAEVGMGEETFWFVVTGALTDRKNVPMIVEGVRTAAARVPGRRLGLALIGPHRTSAPLELREILGNDVAKIGHVAVDRVLTNFEMNVAVAAADAVVMAYTSHSPNSTMLKARALGVRLVVAGPKSVRQFARGMGFHTVVNVDETELANAMIEAIGSEAPSPLNVVPTGQDFGRFLLVTALGMRNA